MAYIDEGGQLTTSDNFLAASLTQSDSSCFIICVNLLELSRWIVEMGTNLRKLCLKDIVETL